MSKIEKGIKKILKLCKKFEKASNKLIKNISKSDKLQGGLADGKSPKDFDKDALRRGTLVEEEHTEDSDLAQEIAMDHLTEDPDYYDKLEKMENE